MKRLIWLPLAGFLLIAGAAVAAAAPTVMESARGLLAPAVDDSDIDATHVRFGPGELLEQVLAGLVADGTITQAQSDAITTGLQAAADEKMAEMEARRTLIAGFVEDGVITQEEIDQLPADDPLRAAWNSIANDGQVSLDQLRDLGPGFGPGFGPGGRGHGHGGPGFLMWGPGPDTVTEDTSAN
jgi:hypothetical protein